MQKLLVYIKNFYHYEVIYEDYDVTIEIILGFF